MITRDIFSEYSNDKYLVHIVDNKILVKEPINCNDKLNEKIQETLEKYLKQNHTSADL
jgi:hypothetical protein